MGTPSNPKTPPHFYSGVEGGCGNGFPMVLHVLLSHVAKSTLFSQDLFCEDVYIDISMMC